MRRSLRQIRQSMYMTPKSLQRLVIPLLLAFFLAFIVSKMPLRAKFHSLLPKKIRGSTTAASTDISSINQLGIRLFAELQGENTLISPYSIAAVLTLAVEGTKPGSITNQQFRQILPSSISLITPVDKNVTLSAANVAWIGNVRNDYISIVRTYDGDVRPLPSTVEEVNSLVSKATQGNIENLISELPRPLIAFLVNAVFFKAPWTTKFDKADTDVRPFAGVGKVKMMRMHDESFGYKEVDSVIGRLQIVEIPYGNGEFAAVVVLPAEGIRLQDVITKLRNGDEDWSKLTSGLTITKLDELAMPRFKLEYGCVSLKSALTNVGVEKAWYLNVSDPPFSRMTDDREAYLSNVLHKASMECTEDGTVASAASAAIIMTRSMPVGNRNPSVVMNRPFLFGIRGRGGELLFIGRVDRPVEP